MKIKQIAIPKLQRSTVQTASGDLVTANYRVGKTAWLTKEDDEVINRVTRRFELISNLTSQTAEELQVVNYGVGGQYEVGVHRL
jgi:prolyl 4-hydroxylase